MGLWFIPVIAAGYAAKKIFDAVTSESSSSSSSSLGDKIESRQERRTKVRRERLEALINSRRNAVVDMIEGIAAAVAHDVGKIAVKKTSLGANVAFEGIDTALRALDRHCTRAVSTSSHELCFDSLSMNIDEVLRNADNKFGSMAGFNNADVYHKNLDPFLKYLDELERRTASSCFELH